MRSIIVGALAALAFSGPTFAGPITVNGDVSDWGITVADNNGSLNFTNPSVTGKIIGTNLFFHADDQPDTWGDSGYLHPHYGGQNYDAEFMGLAFDGNTMYLTIVTGQRPDNGREKFSPGDIRIVASKNGVQQSVFGIEVGGGLGGTSGLNVLTDGNPGSTYTLNSGGYTLSHADSPRMVGSIWENPNWLLDPIAHEANVQMTNDTTTGTQVGTADFIYTRNGDATAQHAVIELSLNRSLFGLDVDALDIYWGPSCNNDVVEIFDDLPRQVPEPGTLAALGIGFLALRLVRQRR